MNSRQWKDATNHILGHRSAALVDSEQLSSFNLSAIPMDTLGTPQVLQLPMAASTPQHSTEAVEHSNSQEQDRQLIPGMTHASIYPILHDMSDSADVEQSQVERVDKELDQIWE